jgi:hypothetical protein
MSYTEINRKYISKTRKEHSCEWCGSSIDIGSESWYRFYEFDGEKHSAYMHPECTRACSLANADPIQDLQGSWQIGDYERGEWICKEDHRYPHRSTWDILRQVEAFAAVKAGDKVHSSIAPQRIIVVETIGEKGLLVIDGKCQDLIDLDIWVLDDWRTLEGDNS